MKALKRVKQTALFGVITVALLSISVFSAQSLEETSDGTLCPDSSEQSYEVYTKNNASALSEEDHTGPFDDVKPTDHIVPLSDGGFLVGSGEVEIFSLDDLETPIDVIDLDNNKNEISKEMANQLFHGDSNCDVPDVSQESIVSGS